LRGSETRILIAGQGQVKLKPHESNQSSAGDKPTTWACTRTIRVTCMPNWPCAPAHWPYAARLGRRAVRRRGLHLRTETRWRPRRPTSVLASASSSVRERICLNERVGYHCGPKSGGASLPAMHLSLAYDQVSSFSSVTWPTCGV
jgi:hypothetical protein